MRSELLGLSSVLAFEVEEIGTGEEVVGLYYWPGPVPGDDDLFIGKAWAQHFYG